MSAASKVICIMYNDEDYVVVTGGKMWRILTPIRSSRAEEILDGLYKVRLKEWDKGFYVAYSDQAFADLWLIRVMN